MHPRPLRRRRQARGTACATPSARRRSSSWKQVRWHQMCPNACQNPATHCHVAGKLQCRYAHAQLESSGKYVLCLSLPLRWCPVLFAAILLFTLLVALGFGVWCMGILDAPTRFESVRQPLSLPMLRDSFVQIDRLHACCTSTASSACKTDVVTARCTSCPSGQGGHAMRSEECCRGYIGRWRRHKHTIQSAAILSGSTYEQIFTYRRSGAVTD
jgi:hypothetical protein